jgi:hypothetical protein
MLAGRRLASFFAGSAPQKNGNETMMMVAKADGSAAQNSRVDDLKVKQSHRWLRKFFYGYAGSAPRQFDVVMRSIRYVVGKNNALRFWRPLPLQVLGIFTQSAALRVPVIMRYRKTTRGPNHACTTGVVHHMAGRSRPQLIGPAGCQH